MPRQIRETLKPVDPSRVYWTGWSLRCDLRDILMLEAGPFCAPGFKLVFVARMQSGTWAFAHAQPRITSGLRGVPMGAARVPSHSVIALDRSAPPGVAETPPRR